MIIKHTSINIGGRLLDGNLNRMEADLKIFNISWCGDYMSAECHSAFETWATSAQYSTGSLTFQCKLFPSWKTTYKYIYIYSVLKCGGKLLLGNAWQEGHSTMATVFYPKNDPGCAFRPFSHLDSTGSKGKTFSKRSQKNSENIRYKLALRLRLRTFQWFR